MPTYKTPDVYVEEIPVFPPSVAEVGTAIPAFIGYTEKAKKIVADDLKLKPTKIYSFAEYESLYGGPEAEKIEIEMTANASEPGGYAVTSYKVGTVAPPALPAHYLYWALKAYFDNGGGQCYVVSVGSYTAA